MRAAGEGGARTPPVGRATAGTAARCRGVGEEPARAADGEDTPSGEAGKVAGGQLLGDGRTGRGAGALRRGTSSGGAALQWPDEARRGRSAAAVGRGERGGRGGGQDQERGVDG